MPRFNTDKKDFARFRLEFRHAAAGYRLGNWKLTFKHKFLKNNRAEVIPDIEDETAEVILSTDWDGHKESEDDEFLPCPVTVQNIKKTARHECRHLLLQPLVAMLDRSSADEDEVEHHEHVIISKMEHFDEYKPKKGARK
jgi:hypothetical protein